MSLSHQRPLTSFSLTDDDIAGRVVGRLLKRRYIELSATPPDRPPHEDVEDREARPGRDLVPGQVCVMR